MLKLFFSFIVCTVLFLNAADPGEFLKQDRVIRVSFDEKNGEDSLGHAQIFKAPGNPQFTDDGRGGLAWHVRKNDSFQYKTTYPLLKEKGSLSFWVTPGKWIRRGEASERGYLFFLRAGVGKGSFVVERQGFAGKRRDYLITLLYKTMSSMPMVISSSTEHWESGKWHLIVVNWDENSFAVSLDGGKFSSAKYPRPLGPEDFSGEGSFTLGGASVAEDTLLDDFAVYKRHLTQDDAQQMFKNGLKLSVMKKEPSSSSKQLSWNSSMQRSFVRLPMMKKPPVIDGRIHEEEWRDALKSCGAYSDALRLDGRGYAGYWNSDGKNLYFAVRSELPPDGKLITNHSGRDQSDVGYDDSVEFWIAPEMGKMGKLYAGILNFSGGFYDFCFDIKKKKLDPKWNSGIRTRSGIVNGEWHLEAVIPLKSLGGITIKEGQPWGFRLVRNFKRPSKQADWSPLGGAFINPETMGEVVWDQTSPVVRSVPFPQKNGEALAFELVNPTRKAIPVRITSFWENTGNTSNVNREELILQPGETKNYPLVKKTASGEYQVIFQVDSLDGKKQYYVRKFLWNSRGKETAWSVSKSRSGADFKFGYYPYTSRIRTLLDLSGYEGKNNVVGSSVILCAPDGKVLLEKAFSASRNNVSEMCFSVPELKNGKYTLKAVVKNSLGKSETLEEGTFEQKVFPWFHNRLGISDEVISPYTPLKRTGNTVESVLRRYDLGTAGLPEQILSAGKEILSAPVSFRISVNGKKQVLRAKELEFTVTKTNEIRYQTDWSAGTLKGRTSAFTDYDGMFKLTVDFSLPESDQLSCFDLVIPVKPENAKLMHVLSDTGKASVTSKVPAGKNPVWESMFIDHNSSLEIDNKVGRFPGTFVPYIWIGNEDRGICWFANNDKDWLPDDKQSVVLVNRYEDHAEIVIRFVTKPSVLKRKHSITFALQATPTKPMPEKPLNWRKITVGSLKIEGCHTASFLGSAFHWGGEDYFSFTPRGKDERIFRIMKDLREGKNPQSEIEEWTNGYNPATPFLPVLMRSLKTGLGMMKSSPGTVLPYTNMRGLSVREEEFAVFKDEWLIGDYAPRKWRDFEDYAYCALTAPSRQDFILWCLDRMLKSGAIDGIYFDVTYPKASRNLVTGNAYYDDNGNLRPGCDLFESRELLKRCAVLTWQQRGYNLNMAHMSFTLIPPIHTWAGSILDWEARYGMDDFQDRFTRTYIRTLSLGTQIGCVPVVCGSLGITGKGDRSRVQRTLIGMILTHEIKDWALGWGRNSLYEQILRQLYQFGYGEADCKVSRDWDADFPVVIKGVDYSALTLSRGGKMLLIICDYGKGGKTTVTLKPGTGLKGIFQCSDGTKTAALKDGCSFDLPAHDFRILTIE